MYEEDFVKEVLIDVKIDKREFKFREITGEEHDKVAGESISISEDGKINMDLGKRNLGFLLTMVIEAPYETNGKKYKDMNIIEKTKVLKKLNFNMFGKLCKEANKILGVSKETEKK